MYKPVALEGRLKPQSNYKLSGVLIELEVGNQFRTLTSDLLLSLLLNIPFIANFFH